MEFKQLEYKKRLATHRKENIQRNLVIKQKEREVKRAEKEVKAWEEVSNAFTIDQLFESDDGTYADSELHNHPGQAQEPQQERWETRSEINRRVNDRVKNWREGNPYSDSYVNIDSYLPLPPVKPAIAAAVNPLEEAKQIMSPSRFQPSEPTHRLATHGEQLCNVHGLSSSTSCDSQVRRRPHPISHFHEEFQNSYWR